MRKEVFIAVGIVLCVLLLSGLASAGIEIDKNASFIDKRYSAGDFVRGRVRISFSDIDGGASFNGNFDGGKKLIDLLKDIGYVAGVDFSCSPANCENGYTEGLDAGSGSVEFDLNQKKTYGFKLNGKNVLVSDFDFRIFGGAEASCNNQIYADFFDDGTIDFFNTNYDARTVCGEKNFGCFDEGGEFLQTGFGSSSQAYCEKITLPVAPAYRVGAKVEGSGGTSLELLIVDLEGNKACNGGTNRAEAVPLGDEINAVIPCGFTKETESLVCVKDSEGNGDYTLRAEKDAGDACGATVIGRDISFGDFDYEIYAEPLAYDKVGWLDAKNYSDPASEVNLPKEADNYIRDVYNRSCENNCYIPISFWRGDSTDLGLNQRVTLMTNNEQFLNYRAEGLFGLKAQKFFELFESGFKVSSNNFTNLDVEKMEFEVPREKGNKEFTLSLGEEEIFSEDIDIEVGFYFDISPRFGLIGKRTVFNVISDENITSSIWDFGEGGSTVNSANGQSTHLYDEAGTYFINAELTNDKGETSSRKVKIIIGETETSARVLLEEARARIDNLKKEIVAFQDWMKKAIEEDLDLITVEGKVILEGNKFESASADEDYIEIINSLLILEIPSSVFVKEIGEIPGSFGFVNIEPKILAEISGETITNSEEVKQGILSWMEENYDFDINFETFVKRTDLAEKIVLRKYVIELNKKQGSEDSFPFLVLNNARTNMVFRDSSNVKETPNGKAYVQIDSLGKPSTIDFFIASSSPPTPDGIGIYISPKLSELNVVDKQYGGIFRPEGEFLWARFLIATGLLLLVFLIIYVSLQIWYKKYYEKHLFKNPNHLYNLINFIYNSRRAGLEDKEIRENLKKQRWSGEQITYAFKKIDGVRTGMWEIPIFKFVENRKVKKEIEKRQGGPLDARFIKRPVVY